MMLKWSYKSCFSKLKGQEPEWSNPQIEELKLPEMLKSQIKIIYIYRKGKGVKFSKT